jgi:hypothetical protein
LGHLARVAAHAHWLWRKVDAVDKNLHSPPNKRAQLRQPGAGRTKFDGRFLESAQ